MEELSNRINNSSGLYMTSEEQTDGSSIYYMHDKPTLEESMIVWKITAEAVAVSTDGGKTYNAGLTVDGTLIAKIMNTIGINFDWGVGGSLIIKDKNNAETFYVDAETGIVRIVADSFTLRGKTIEKITSDQLNDFNDSELNQQGIFNRLTNDGAAQGIFLRDGQLYLNGQYMEFNGAKIGGWQINGNQLLNNQTNFNVRLQAPTVYGSSGLGTADVFTVHDLANDTWPFVLTSDGTLDLGDYFKYRPNGMTHDSNVKLSVGGWQIKNGENAWGYDHFEYWDTEQTQENGICSHGPWVIWGGWNQGSSLDYVNSYKFVVSDKGDIYGQKFFDNGQQILPIIAETMHVTFTSGWTGIIKDGYFLLNAFLVRSDNSIYVDGIQRRSDGWYLVLLQKPESVEADLYTVWCKNPD